MSNTLSQTLGVSPLFPDPEARHSVVGSSRKILFTEESLTTDALSVDVGSLNYTIENIHRSSLSTVSAVPSCPESLLIYFEYHRVPWTTVCTCPLCQPGQFESHTPVVPRMASTQTEGVSEIAAASNSTPQRRL